MGGRRGHRALDPGSFELGGHTVLGYAAGTGLRQAGDVVVAVCCAYGLGLADKSRTRPCPTQYPVLDATSTAPPPRELWGQGHPTPLHTRGPTAVPAPGLCCCPPAYTAGGGRNRSVIFKCFF